MKNNMRIVDIDMDYFLKEIPIIISENNTDRLPDEDYQVWSKDEVIDFLENKLGLSKETKIKGKIVTHHNEALYYWRKLIQEERLSIPFEVVHIDSHADLGLGYPSWTFIIDSLITVPVEERTKIENYGNMFEKYYEPKELVHVSQLKAAVQVNTEMIRMYWHIGKEISDKHADAIWGTGFYKTMSQSLKEEFPSVSGFSVTNLKYMKRFFEFYKSDNENRQQVVDDLEKICSIPWGHHILIMTKCENVTEALFYVRKTLENGWSRAMLLNFLDVNLYKSQGKAITNFDRQLPALQSDLAKEVIKDPYNFDFLTLTEGYREKELEDALTNNITKFLLELGQGFAYIGRQQPIMIGQKEMAMDLLFYHMKLRCYVVIDLKVGEFDASYTSQIGTYVVAVNHQLKTEMDNPTIGLIICKTKDNVVAEYSLEASSVPIGISEYQLSKVLPKEIESSLPSIEEIEKSLKAITGE